MTAQTTARAWLAGHKGRAAVAVLAVAAASLAGGGPAASASTHGVTPATAPKISTIAGGVGGPGLATRLNLWDPCGLAYSGGSLYASVENFNDEGTIREINPQTDQLSTPAGTGEFGPLGTGGLATGGSIQQGCGVGTDKSGDIVVTNWGQVLQFVPAATGTYYGHAMTAKHIYTVAGDGTAGYSGDGGLGTRAEIDVPGNAVMDSAGNLVFADQQNYRIRVVAAKTGTFYGQAMTTGHIYTVAGDGTRTFSGDGGPATSAGMEPDGVALDGAGNLVFADLGNDRIRVVAERTGTFYGQAMTAGDVYTVAGNGTAAFSGDGGPATSAEVQPFDVTVDGAGNLVIADTNNTRIRVVAESTGTFYGQAMTAGDIYTIAGGGSAYPGDGGPATAAHLSGPEAVTLDGNGNVVLTEQTYIQVVAESTGTFYHQAMTAGDIYTIGGGAGQSGPTGVGGLAKRAQIGGPSGVTADAAGNVLFSTGLLQIVAKTSGTFYKRAMTAGHLYTIGGGGTSPVTDGLPATSADLSDLQFVTVDAAGNLVLSCASSFYGTINQIVVLATKTGTFYGQAMTAGDLYIIAGTGTYGYSGNGTPALSAELAAPSSATVDAAGNVVFSDYGNRMIRVLAEHTGTFYGQAMTAGDIYTVAGDGGLGYVGSGVPATDAGLDEPRAVTVASNGNLIIADSYHRRVRVVAESTGTFYGQAMTAGDIYTVAGVPKPGSSGNGGLGTKAHLSYPQALAVDSAGNVIIGDEVNTVRVLAERAGTFYGQAMKAGHIYALAGTGTNGFYGDGGPATKAELTAPAGVAVAGDGDILIADSSNSRVREVTG
ncbi:MAG: hypothetical protein ACRDNF_24135 [Streptosporangiaceae bacterium]